MRVGSAAPGADEKVFTGGRSLPELCHGTDSGTAKWAEAEVMMAGPYLVSVTAALANMTNQGRHHQRAAIEAHLLANTNPGSTSDQLQ